MTTSDQPDPCLPPAELLAWRTAWQRSAVRGVDAGPDTTVVLLATIRRLARAVTDVQHLAERAAHNTDGVDPEAIYRATAAPATEGDPH